MTASLSGVFSLQEFTDAGLSGVGYRVYTYTTGTTTFKTAYTDAAGAVPQTYTADGLGGQYIALNARGELPAPLFLTAGAYDITLKRPDGSTVWTRQAIGGADAASSVLATLVAFIASLVSGTGATLVGFLAKGSAFVRLLQDKLRDSASPADYPGGDYTGATDSTAAIVAALANNSCVDLGDSTKTWKISGTLLVGANKNLISNGANIVVAADVTAIRTTDQSARVTGMNISWSVANTVASNGVEVGDVASNARMSILERITVTGAGGSSFVGRHGNLCKTYNCSSVSPKKYDYLTTVETVDCNDWTNVGFSGNASVTGGIFLTGGVDQNDAHASRAHTFIGCSIQGSSGKSCYVNTPGNVFYGLYLENGVGADLHLDQFAYGNEVVLTQGGVFLDTTAPNSGNYVSSQNVDGSKRRQPLTQLLIAGGALLGLRWSNSDGTAGEWVAAKTGARELTISSNGSSSAANVRIINAVAGQITALRVSGNVTPITNNTATIGESGLSYAGGFTQVAFTITSDGGTKTEKRAYSDPEIAAATTMADLPCFYKLKTSVAEKGSDAARWHSGMVAQAVAQCFVDQGLDPARYAMWCSDPVMTGIGDVLLDGDGQPIMEGGGEPMVDRKGKPLTNEDGTPMLHPGFPVTDQVGKPLIVDGVAQVQLALRYEEAHSFIIAALAQKLKAFETRLARLEALLPPAPAEAA